MKGEKGILITGGLGYLGSSISHLLSKATSKPVILTTRRESKDWRDFKYSGVSIIQNDLLDKKRLHESLKNVDTVLHLAGPDERMVLDQPDSSIDSALKLTRQLLEVSNNADVKNFLYFSTIHVYGNKLQGTISESACPAPNHPYGILNRAAEDFALIDQKDLKSIVVRISNAFGPPVHPEITRWSLLVNDLCRMIIEKGEIVLHSDGSQYRDFISIPDLVDALRILIKVDRSEVGNGIFNVCSGESISVYEMAKLIQKVAEKELGESISVTIAPPKRTSFEDAKYHFDISKLRRLGFNPKGEWEKSICETLQFCQDNFSRQS